MSYSDKLRDPRWQKKRLQVLNRDKFTCKKCGDKETTLHVHHKEYINGRDPWEYELSNFITLCEDCHGQIESLKNEAYIDDIKIYKSDNWQDGSKIMFTSYQNICSMEIYDNKNKYVCGYNISDFEVKNIIKILRKALKNG